MRLGRTDGRTDGQMCRSIYNACKAVWSAVKSSASMERHKWHSQPHIGEHTAFICIFFCSCQSVRNFFQRHPKCSCSCCCYSSNVLQMWPCSQISSLAPLAQGTGTHWIRSYFHHKLVQSFSACYLRHCVISSQSSLLDPLDHPHWSLFSNHQLTSVSRSQTALHGRLHLTCGKNFFLLFVFL